MRERFFAEIGLVPIQIAGRYLDWNVWQNYPQLYPCYENYFIAGMVDVVSEKYHQRSRDGEIVNNPMWAFTFGLKQTKMRISCEGQCNYYVVHEPEVCLPGHYVPFTKDRPVSAFVDSICDPFSDESSIAQTQAWANIDVSEIQGLASLGELPETVKMLIDALKSAMKLTIAMKRGDLATIAKSAKKVGFTVDGLSDLWLGYRYGIRPLITDIKNLLSAASADLEKGQRFTARGKKKFEEKSTIKDLTTGRFQYNCNLGLKYTEIRENSRIFRAGVLVMIDRSINQAAAIWGLDSPIEAAWELIPFSFIVDWFTNIGDVIGALVLNPSLTPLSSWVTETISSSVVREATGVYDMTYSGCWQTSKSAYAKDPLCRTTSYYTVKRRVPLAERYSLPSLNVRLNVAKLTDLALIARKIF